MGLQPQRHGAPRDKHFYRRLGRLMSNRMAQDSQASSRKPSQAILDLAQQVAEAAERIKFAVTETPVEQIGDLASGACGDLFFKLENLQQTGSFKLRGASNKILSLSPGEAALGVIAASNGNHGLGVAAAARRA